jgi:hypothetical protein
VDHDLIELGDVSLNRDTDDVTIAGRPVELTAKEFSDLLRTSPNLGAVLSRDAARPCVGRFVPGRHAYGGRARRPTAPQARPPRKPDPLHALRGSGRC